MAVELLEKKNIRLDLYLFYIRIFKSRSLSTKYILSNRLRISGQVTKKPHKLISVGDVLTLSINDQVKILEVLDIPKRRGSFVETLFFYKDLTPIPKKEVSNKYVKKIKFLDRAGRPTKLERRQTDKLMGRS